MFTKTYDRWGGTQAFGLICSPSSNAVYDGKLAFLPALEDVLVTMWHESGHRAEVTCMAQSPQKDVFAVGYMDGSIRLWSVETASSIVVLNGHKKSVTAMCFDSTGQRLASGSQDTNVILWDVVAETGLFRLRGHRDQITGIKFIEKGDPSTSKGTTSAQFLVTSGKDTFLKLWDLSTQHCIQSMVAHRSEVWTLDIDPSGSVILTGSGEGEIKAWKIDHEELDKGLQETSTGEYAKMIHPLTTLPMTSKHRVSQLAYHPTAPFLAIQSHEKAVDVFRIRTEDEIRKKQARRQKRAKEKKVQKAEALQEAVNEDDDHAQKEIQLVDLYTPYLVIFTALSTNSAEVYTIPLPTKTKETPEAARIFSLDLPGHRTDIRVASLSADEQLLATASSGMLKIWNMKSMTCIRTLECGYAVCGCFLPGDRHVIIGTKSGELELFDVASASKLETIKAHTSTVWSLHIRPDFGGLVTGSADKDVKFWDFEDKKDEEQPSRKVKTLVHTRTLKMSDEVLAVRYSPNSRFLAVALLDATVKIFYQDTLKFFLSLYGHKLPVLSLDISSDSKLIITSSSDKNVKIWGMDFGDCHKSIFAHEESVMQVLFEPRSHRFFSVSKDRWVKHWDGDTFQLIQKMDGHHGEIWAMAIGSSGDILVTGSHDKSIRIWENVKEIVVPAELRENEQQALDDQAYADELNREERPIGSGVEGGMELAGSGYQAEATMVQKTTTETLMAGEKIAEAMELADKYSRDVEEYQRAKERLPASEREKYADALPNSLRIRGEPVSPDEYVLDVIEKVQNAALYDALLALPFSQVTRLLHYMDAWAKKGIQTTLTSNMLAYLLRIHSSQIVATRSLRPLLVSLRGHLRLALSRQRTQMGYNLAALRFIKRQDDDTRTAEFYERGEREEWAEEDIEAARERLQSGESKKRKRVSIKA
ncbi:Uncharacterized WD repeat-containing protein C3D6.12 [Serendipita indica DSM 11827]|nr:Uncharacterized WD repeat-containing protein C3D6.12 [Serendipita indica DSM 11827]